MPIYEFECNRCGKTVEIRCSYKDIKKMPCKCGGELIKQFTPTKSVFIRWGRKGKDNDTFK